MSNSGSDSDCFESADEGFDDEYVSTSDNVKSSHRQNGSGRTETLTIAGDTSFAKTPDNFQETKTTTQYRKRPERRKNLPEPLAKVSASTSKTSINDQIFKSDIIKPDVLIQDITTNLSKNFNKGVSTIQQTSSSIKDLVMSSLPITASKESSSRFSYDDEEEIASYLPEYEDDTGAKESISKSENSSQDCLISEEKLSQEVEIVTTAEPLEELESNICLDIDMNHFSEILNLDDKCQNIIESTSRDSIEVSQDFKCLNKVKDSCTELEKIEKLEHVLHSEMKREKRENLTDFEVGPDLINNNTKNNELRQTNYECNDSDKLELEECKEDDADSNKDGWDTSELDLDGLEIEESSGGSSFPDKTKSKNTSSQGNEDNNGALENQMSLCNEGWDDFDFDDDLNDVKTENEEKLTEKHEDSELGNTKGCTTYVKNLKTESANENNYIGIDNTWSGWDHFGEKPETRQKSGWTLSGWGVNALLNTATSVTQGLSTVLEAGLGAPDPESLAKMEIKSNKDNNGDNSAGQKKEKLPTSKSEEQTNSGLNLFPSFGITNLVAGVTKNIVEHSKVHEISSKVISGSLDTLESFGKKTMEVLQEGDPGLKKKRALLLGSDKPILSQVLREAKERAEIEDKKMEEKQMAKLCHFETLFDDFQGLIHLEALEMLSRQCELKLEQMKSSLPMKEVEDMMGILDEVKELCEIDEDEFKSNYSSIIDFKISLTKATEPLKNEVSIHKIVEVYEELSQWMKSEENWKRSQQILFHKAISALAELTAATVQQFHKGGELLAIKEHRKTVEEADALLQMTGIICCKIEEITERFLNLQTSQTYQNDINIKKKIGEESVNAASYIKDAFHLLIPVLQLGAAT